MAATILAGCSATKYVPEGSYLLDDVSLVTDSKSLKSDELQMYIRQFPNNKWFSIFNTQLHIYSLSGRDSTNWVNKALRRMGDAPVIYSNQETERSREELEKAVRNKGYMRATVSSDLAIKGKKAALTYRVKTGRPYTISDIALDVPDEVMMEHIQERQDASLIEKGMNFDVSILDDERDRISALLQDNGFYSFNKEYITYSADTVQNTFQVALTMHVNPIRSMVQDSVIRHRQYRMGDIRFLTDYNALQEGSSVYQASDSLTYKDYTILSSGRPFLRSGVLSDNTKFQRGDIYSSSDVQDTYQNFGRLGAIRYTNINFKERETQDAQDSILTLDADIMLTKGKTRNVAFEVEGTNSAGDLGAAASVSFSNKNIFHGSETFSFKLRGAYEAISGVHGDYRGDNYKEIGVESSINFPQFMAPFLSRNFKQRIRANSLLNVSYNFQMRPEFTRDLASASWSYTWQTKQSKKRHQFDLLDINYLYVPWISQEFYEKYLDKKDNYILKYNFEDRLIVRTGYSYVYNSANQDLVAGKSNGNSYTLRVNVEAAGNLLYGLSKAFGIHRNANNEYTILGIPYAQYIKGDIDYAKNIVLDPKNSVAFHLGAGVAYPYGNGTMIPFEKRYFSGGANSVRGWSVRGLGPGSFDGDGNFLNQTGDLKLDASVELRSQLFWKISGALFVDAGNIWTLRKYENQPGGEFRFDKFYKQIAVAYGLGLRMDLEFFILRFDGGMKAINPVIPSGKGHYPLLHPKFSRDFTFHFAVGYPF